VVSRCRANSDMNHQCSGWSRVADSTPARIVGKSASRVPMIRILSKYRRNMRKCEAVFADRAGHTGAAGNSRGLSPVGRARAASDRRLGTPFSAKTGHRLKAGHFGGLRGGRGGADTGHRRPFEDRRAVSELAERTRMNPSTARVQPVYVEPDPPEAYLRRLSARGGKSLRTVNG